MNDYLAACERYERTIVETLATANRLSAAAEERYHSYATRVSQGIDAAYRIAFSQEVPPSESHAHDHICLMRLVVKEHDKMLRDMIGTSILEEDRSRGIACHFVNEKCPEAATAINDAIYHTIRSFDRLLANEHRLRGRTGVDYTKLTTWIIHTPVFEGVAGNVRRAHDALRLYYWPQDHLEKISQPALAALSDMVKRAKRAPCTREGALHRARHISASLLSDAQALSHAPTASARKHGKAFYNIIERKVLAAW